MVERGNAGSPAILGDDKTRTYGTSARRYNLLAAKLIADLVRNSFGPAGLYKLLTDILGEATLTKDGATILRKIDVDHPAAKALIDAANSVDNEVGDGTISVVIFAAALLEKAEEMILAGIPPTVIMDGYQIGLETALASLKQISRTVENNDDDVMGRLVRTCLNSKILSDGGPEVVNSIVNAVKSVADFARHSVEIDDIKIEEKPGTLGLTELVRGIVVDKTVDSSAMPKNVDNAKILLIHDELDGRSTRTTAEISIRSPDQLGAFTHEARTLIKSKVDHIIDSGASVVFSRQGINAYAQELLAKARIMSIKRVKENDLLWLAKATGANLAESLDHEHAYHHHHTHDHGLAAQSQDHRHYRHGDLDIRLGYAGRVCEKFVGDDRVVMVEGCQDPRAVTLLLRADSKRTLDECHRAALDAISVLRDFVLDPRIVAGGGSSEFAIARSVRDNAKTISGKVQIAVQKFSDALEEIPLTLARNAGMDAINTLASLRLEHSRSNRDTNAADYGVDTVKRIVVKMYPEVIEPALMKEQVLKTAVEVANLLIRVDDVVMSKPAEYTHTHGDGTQHSHQGGDKVHEHDYFDALGKKQRPSHHYY